jgi:hypothetical protein
LYVSVHLAATGWLAMVVLASTPAMSSGRTTRRGLPLRNNEKNHLHKGELLAHMDKQMEANQKVACRSQKGYSDEF